MDQGVKMFARFVHDQDGVTTNTQPYGKPGELCCTVFTYCMLAYIYGLVEPMGDIVMAVL